MVLNIIIGKTMEFLREPECQGSHFLPTILYFEVNNTSQRQNISWNIFVSSQLGNRPSPLSFFEASQRFPA